MYIDTHSQAYKIIIWEKHKHTHIYIIAPNLIKLTLCDNSNDFKIVYKTHGLISHCVRVLQRQTTAVVPAENNLAKTYEFRNYYEYFGRTLFATSFFYVPSAPY